MRLFKNNKIRYLSIAFLFLLVFVTSFIFVDGIKTNAAWTESAYMQWAGYSKISGEWAYTKKTCGELKHDSCTGHLVVQDHGTAKSFDCNGRSEIHLKCNTCGYTFIHSLTNTHSFYETQVGGYIHKLCKYCTYDDIVRPIEYKIQFEKNDNDGDNVTASGTMSSVKHKYGESMNLPDNQFKRRFYSFDGWMTSASGNVVFRNKADITNWLKVNGSDIADGSTVKLYAKWKGQWTLSITLWGGTLNGQTGTVTYTGNQGDTINLSVPTKNGYKFVKWNADGIAGTLSSTTSAATYTFPNGNGFDSIEAVWSVEQYKIKYDGNDATSGSMDSQTITVDIGSQTIQENLFVRTGYTFTSWNTKADGSGTTYNPGDTYRNLANVTLYAQWSKNESTLVVNPDGGSWNGHSGTQSFKKEYGDVMNIPIPTKDGYEFERWVDVPLYGSLSSWTGAGTYTFGAASSVSDTLTAVWREKAYTITYNANGGVGAVESQAKSHTSDIILQYNSFYRSGMLFSHWNTKADGTGTSYDEGAIYSANANVTLYAIWVTSTYESASGVEMHAFDTDCNLPNVGVTNLTITYDTSNNVEVDFASNTTDVAFAGWTMYNKYDDAAYSYSDYNTGGAVTGNYYDESSLTNTLDKLKSFVGCGQCSSLLFHGSLRNAAGDTLHRHFDYDHDGSTSPSDCGLAKIYSGKWAETSGENKGDERNSLAVASFKGSWKLVFPNAYKTGYVFIGWYAEVADGTQGGEKIPELGTGTYKYMGMAGDTYDFSNLVREHNTNVTSATDSPTGLKNIDVGVNNNLSGIKLFPRFEPIHYKVLYVMNIPSSSDASTECNGLQSHSLISNSASLTKVHSLKDGGSVGNTYTTNTASIGTTNEDHKDYSYIGEKTYIYDGSDWTLEDIPITVNDYYFTGWTYDDIVWTGYGGMKVNGVVLGETRIGNSLEDTHSTDSDYSLKTLSMSPNVVQNIKNNLPDTANDNKGNYTSYYTVKNAKTFSGLSVPQSDGTNPSAGTKVSKLNINNPTVYIVLKANWSTDYAGDVTYHSNNEPGATYTDEDAFTKLTEYYDVFNSKNANLSDSGFGSKYNTYVVDSKDTAVGDTSNDGSYDYNVTSDRFVVNNNVDKYFSGKSNGREGFFSFQGWSTWKYATWRDAIDSNKKDTTSSELQYVGAESGNALGHDNETINSSFSSGSLMMRRYNDVERPKRVGDLFYRMSAILYPYTSYNGTASNYNANGYMLNSSGTGDKYKVSTSETIWDAYKWRWTQGKTGNYSIALNEVFADRNIDLYAIWDSYPTSSIENIYVYLSDISTLTPKYLFSKVIAYDYEDFWNQKNYAIGETYQGGVDWGEVACTSDNMDSLNAGSYTYTYNIKGDEAYMNGKFTATLMDYDYNRFVNATFVDDVASVSMMFKFVDSAGNTTYKSAWIYIIDEDDTERDNVDPEDPDNTRYSLTRFISEEFYNKADFDENGNYIIGSADESAGSLLVRSKWYLNNSYRAQLLSAFERLKTVGDSSMKLNANILNLWGGKVDYVDESGNEHQYHPQLNLSTGKWEYPWDNLKTQTKGVYVFEYEDILKTKQFIQNNNLNTGNYSGGEDTIQKYIDDIFKNTAAKDSNGNTLRIND